MEVVEQDWATSIFLYHQAFNPRQNRASKAKAQPSRAEHAKPREDGIVESSLALPPHNCTLTLQKALFEKDMALRDVFIIV